MNSLRSVPQAKINFLFFQDIITSVMGILILITLMLSLSIRSGEFGATPDVQFESQLKDVQNRLAQIEAENRAAQKQILDAAAVPDRTALENQAAALRRQATLAEEERRQSEAARARADNSAADRQSSTNLENSVSALEKNLASLRERLASTQRQSNAVYIALPPELNQSARKPVAFIVANDKIQIRSLTSTNAVERALSVATDLKPLLSDYDPARDYLIFYFRPSGVKWFAPFREVARAAGFEVGYDAIEEPQEIIFTKP